MMLLQSRGAMIGVEPAANAFRAVAVRDGAVCAAVAVSVVDPEVSRAEAARRAFAALERQGIHSVSACVAVAPLSVMTSAVLELPPRSSGAPIEDLAAAEMTRGIGCGGLELAVFSIRARENGPSEYFVTAAQRDGVVTLVEDLGACGVEVVAVDAPVTALARACGSPNCLIVSIEDSGLSFHAVQAGSPILSRSVPLSRGGVSTSLLVAEIDRCAGYLATYRADTAIEEIVLVGDVDVVPAAARDVAADFEVGVRVWTPPASSSGTDVPGSAFASAYGAAIWQQARRASA